MNSRGGAGRGGGGGRGRFRGSSRFDGGGGRQGSHPPSRHLWVGNLSHNIEEYDLTRHFLEFGDLDKVSFHPGRSYAFINFKNDEDAIAAYKVLQGFPVDGLPLRIEFAKADKPSSSSRDEDHEQLSPSEVLWISFPAVLKVDEAILRKAFSQFGEIERITVIPGRSYAFVQFRALSSACRAKETLQGKLFGNPRVHISYARNEGRPRSPRLVGDSSDGGGGRYDFVGGGKSSQFDSWRFEEELGPPPNVYERRGGALRGVGRKSSLLYEEEQWDLPAEEDSLYPSNKKLKTGSFEHELPDHHPYSDQESRRAPQGGFADFPYQPEGRGRNVDRWKGSYEDIQQSPAGEPLLHVPVERKRFGGSSEPVVPKPSLKLWQWEGAIAKGGSLVCQARAFPVGKSMEIMLPGYLDCTARTSLDMLSKHYDQAASAWVIFFVPASDADMGHYNEFMHYLGEKQRAAVAKLDERTTLFLVPPSEFSEKVLKVPGDMSISGVVLRLEPQVSNSVVRPPHEPNLHFQGDAHMPYKAAPLPQKDSLGMPPVGFSGSVHPSHGGSMSNAYADHRNEYLTPPQPRNRIDMSPQQASGAGNDLVYHHDPHHQGALPGNSSGHYAGGRSNMSIQQQPTPHSVPSSLGAAGLQPQQLAQLVSSLLGQQGQLGGNNPDPSIADDPRKGSSLAAQTHDLHNNNQQNYEPSSQYGQLQHLQQQTANVLTAMNRDTQSTAVGQMNPPSGVQGGTAGSQGGAGDVKKLEATLELAATLLKQLQQGKGP
ncbi:unnamed protein product [Linum trigynum]|uniref:RRM domain-containing protein n=1 Tax=Linum trigynum TaxID=586398 RepID=A0AAV2GC15_9ROSI